MELLDGSSCSEQIRQEIAQKVDEIKSRGERVPHLAAVLVGNDGASQNYVALKTANRLALIPRLFAWKKALPSRSY